MMGKLRIVLAILIFFTAPAVVQKFTGEDPPGWMIALAITGLIIAVILFFFPTRSDVEK